MGEEDARRLGVRRIDDEAKGVLLQGLKRGLLLPEAARVAGFSPSGFCKARGRDPAFAEAWDEAMEMSATPRFVAPQNGRRLQLKKVRRVRFVDWRKELFLARFAATADETAAAEAAGVCVSTVWRHRQKNAEFARAWQAALDQGYATLEAEALRQRIEAQRRMREDPLPEGEPAREFERVLKLLERWERRNGRVGAREVSRGQRKAWSFEEAIAAIETKLRNLNIPIVGEEPAA